MVFTPRKSKLAENSTFVVYNYTPELEFSIKIKCYEILKDSEKSVRNNLCFSVAVEVDNRASSGANHWLPVKGGADDFFQHSAKILISSNQQKKVRIKKIH